MITPECLNNKHGIILYSTHQIAKTVVIIFFLIVHRAKIYLAIYIFLLCTSDKFVDRVIQVARYKKFAVKTSDGIAPNRIDRIYLRFVWQLKKKYFINVYVQWHVDV